MQHDIFKKENIIHDDFKSTDTDKNSINTEPKDPCITVEHKFSIGDKEMNIVKELKLCRALKKNAGNTEHSSRSVTVYLRAFYRKPSGLISGIKMLMTQKMTTLKFFVLYAYAQNPTTGKWRMVSNESSEPKKFRYEAYLSMEISKLEKEKPDSRKKEET